jgi:hypothetical protein
VIAITSDCAVITEGSPRGETLVMPSAGEGGARPRTACIPAPRGTRRRRAPAPPTRRLAGGAVGSMPLYISFAILHTK